MSLFTVLEARYLIGTPAVVISIRTPFGTKQFQSTQSQLALVNVRRAEDAAEIPHDPNPDLSGVNWGDEDVLVIAKNWIGERFRGMADQVVLNAAS